jgi:hypothetical protein
MQPATYEQDFQRWIAQTIEHLRKGEFKSLDLDNLIEELTDLGKSEKNTLKSNLKILLAHLLKLQVQSDAPDTMKMSWLHSAIEHRQRVLDNLADSPSLKAFWTEAVEKAYPDARKLAIAEGKLAQFGVRVPDETDYPLACPFSRDQILDESFLGESA